MAGPPDRSEFPPPPEAARLTTASFVGGIRSGALGLGGTAPFGHLEFDADELRIWGLGMEVRARRDEVRGVRLSMGFLATKVRVVFLDDSVSTVYFAALGRAAVRDALLQRGWRVIEH